MLLKIIKSKQLKLIFIISVILCSIFLLDEVYNLFIYKIFDLPSALEIYKGLGFKYITFS